MVMTNALWQLIAQSDWICKVILLVLFFMSVLCWSLAFYKTFTLNSKIKNLKKANAIFGDITSFQDFVTKASLLNDNISGQIVAHYLTDLKFVLKTNQKNTKSVSGEDFKSLESSMAKTLESAIASEETVLSVISGAAQTSPLIGLFGTVWGLIHSFLGMSYSQSTSIAAVAPGIAEALITTLSGIIVAVPAIVIYNFLQNKIRIYSDHLIELTDKSFLIMQSMYAKDTKISEAYNINQDIPKHYDKEL